MDMGFLSEHTHSDVSGEPDRQPIFAIDRLQTQHPVQIWIDLRELRAQYDLQEQRDFQRRQTAAGLEVRDRLSNAQPEQTGQLFLAVAARRAESIQIILQRDVILHLMFLLS
jgi:hypothetical protein